MFATPVVTGTLALSTVPSGYVTVTGTKTLPGTVPSGKFSGLSIVTVVPSGALLVSTAPNISLVFVGTP